MTREELETCCEQITEWTKHQSQPIHLMLVHILAHDAEQRQEIAELRALIGTIRGLLGIQPLRNTDDISAEEHSREIIQQVNRMIEQQAQEIARLRESLKGILEIGKRDMTNPKYDEYFEQAKQALEETDK